MHPYTQNLDRLAASHEFFLHVPGKPRSSATHSACVIWEGRSLEIKKGAVRAEQCDALNDLLQLRVA